MSNVKEYKLKSKNVFGLVWTGENHREMYEFLTGEKDTLIQPSGKNFRIDFSLVEKGLVIISSKGEEMIANVGDYVVKVNDEYFPSDPEVFINKYEEVKENNLKEKTFNNTTANQAKDQVKDIEFWGNGDYFKLICKASSKQEKWMKSTKALEIPGIGCIVQVSTQQGDNLAEALTFVPGIEIQEITDDNKKVKERYFTKIK